MAIDQHTISVPSGANPAWADRTIIGSLPNVPNPAAAAAGDTVSVNVAFGNDLPGNSYGVFVNPGQACNWWVSNKANAGFTVNLQSSATVAAGTFDVVVIA